MSNVVVKDENEFSFYPKAPTGTIMTSMDVCRIRYKPRGLPVFPLMLTSYAKVGGCPL